MEEKKSEKAGGLLWLVPVALFLAVGGFFAWFSMKNAAHNLVGGPQAGDLSSSGGVALAGRGADLEARDFFSSDESIQEDALASYEQDRMKVENTLYEKPASARTAATAAAGGDGSAGGGNDAARTVPSPAASGAPGGSGPGGRLASRLTSFKSGSAKDSAKSSLGTAGAGAFGARGGQAHLVSSSGKPAPGGAAGGKGVSMLESLRSAWRGSVIGARDASNDAARALTARSFDGSPSYERLSLQYDEKMKKALDTVDPNSIPKFLRDQDISADRASSYSVPEIGAVTTDKEGTEKALAEDKDYQAKKAMQDMASGMLNPMFGGITSNQNGSSGETGDDGGDDITVMSTPEDDAWLEDLQNQEWTDMGNDGCGEECGCSCAAPCCCLPPPPSGCPTYGPFLPDDPCGADFGVPPAGDGGIWV